MSDTISITQSPSISIVLGAYEMLLKESGSLETQVREARFYDQDINRFVFHNPIALAKRPSLADSRKFERLLSQWHAERNAASSVMEMVICPSYQKIVAMGETAIELILAQLRTEGNEPDHWFWALRVLTEVDPVPEEDRGNIARMAQAWLHWGESYGYAG